VVGKRNRKGQGHTLLAYSSVINNKKEFLRMAKRTNSFQVKGELSLAEGVIYEVKKEEVLTIPFFDILKEFEGKTITFSIKEENEITGDEAPELED